MRVCAAAVTVVAVAAAVAVAVVVAVEPDSPRGSGDVWTWRCESGACVRHAADEVTNGKPFNTCKLTCGALRSIWPRPTGPVSFGTATASFLVDKLQFQMSAPEQVKPLLDAARQIFVDQLKQLQPVLREGRKPGCRPDGGCARQIATRTVKVSLVVDTNVTSLSLDTNEFYQLSVNSSGGGGGDVTALVYAPTFFGARHGLETLSQLMAVDADNACLQVLASAMVSDAPEYPVRALTIDTARIYIPLPDLRRTVDGMAMNKLNTLHWHLTDTHSFPVEVGREARMQRYGAYSAEKVYAAAEVRQLVQYARERGVRLLPELDGPAHVGYGWQWGEKAGLGKLAVCVGQEPWRQYCVEPPCGQMNIVNNNMYAVLDKVLKDFNDMFQPDMFHFGGDEINLNCWKSADEIRQYIKAHDGDPNDNEEYMKLWVFYQSRAQNIWGNITSGRNTPLWLWTSDLTGDSHLRKSLSPDKYIIQVWTTATDQQIGDLLADGYRLVMSNYDAWYLDCGFSAWIGSGHNWCAPYKSWQTVYANSPRAIAAAFQPAGAGRDYSAQLLGGSAALWAEQSDGRTLDSRLWPRAAALAERLWAEPETSPAAALTRLVHHRERMVGRGLGAEPVQPEYCHQSEGSCV